jgi:hypothetical protein
MPVLAHGKFAELIASRDIRLEDIREQYRVAAEMVGAKENSGGTLRDPKNTMVLTCAMGARSTGQNV